jgi:hypothetical protein
VAGVGEVREPVTEIRFQSCRPVDEDGVHRSTLRDGAPRPVPPDRRRRCRRAASRGLTAESIANAPRAAVVDGRSRQLRVAPVRRWRPRS